VSDEPRKLDLIQRYAERLGQTEANVAEILTPAHAKGYVRPIPQIVVESGGPALAEPIQRIVPPARGPSAAEPKKFRERGAHVDIDLARLERLGCIVPHSDQKTPLIEQFQIIKRPLIQKAVAVGPGAVRNGNTVMVTSARPGEGKSFVALNLAMSLASERDLFVLLLDSDHYNDSIPNMLGVQVERGLVDVLLDDSLDVGDVILKTNIPNLSILPSGRRHAHGTELLSSQRMSRVIREVGSRYPNRIIVIDAPPVLASTGTSILASHVGQIIMVVEQNRTGWRLVERSLSRLSDCSDISFVLNKVSPLWEDNYGDAYR
jgi:receptor protein-tyrosine kinase